MSATTLLLQLGLTVIFLAIAAAGILWAIKNGQYDDLEGPAQRILMDDDDPLIPFNTKKAAKPDAIQVETQSHTE
jgi:cbb3-type cytochrome oxidase maturation protein